MRIGIGRLEVASLVLAVFLTCVTSAHATEDGHWDRSGTSQGRMTRVAPQVPVGQRLGLERGLNEETGKLSAWNKQHPGDQPVAKGRSIAARVPGQDALLNFIEVSSGPFARRRDRRKRKQDEEPSAVQAVAQRQQDS
jgi:hypothetical protein